eukprot:TRINITY_DN16133_c0_g1_i2.p1 TRINITY_DN16133_c0_g1~~TRINITY_DN16133_c0_g1_i2.p1  ORF type:complete len:266 (-),score=65.56 TRINITY_DN16133_c0_g1_i2:34-831(-)
MRDVSKKGKLVEAARKASDSTESNIVVLPLDVSDEASIKAAVDTIIAKEGKIDILINNAGVSASMGSIEQLSLSEQQRVFDTNYFGVVRVSRGVLPHMRAANQGHVINISSALGLVGFPFNDTYIASKFALEGLTESLASYYTTLSNIKFTLLEPALFESELLHHGAPQPLLDAAPEYTKVMQAFSGILFAGAKFQAVDELAHQLYDLTLLPSPPLRTRTSPESEAATALKTQADPSGSKFLAQWPALLEKARDNANLKTATASH